MSKNRKYEQKRLAGGRLGAKCARQVMPFADTQRMCIDLNVTVWIKEDSP